MKFQQEKKREKEEKREKAPEHLIWHFAVFCAWSKLEKSREPFTWLLRSAHSQNITTCCAGSSFLWWGFTIQYQWQIRHIGLAWKRGVDAPRISTPWGRETVRCTDFHSFFLCHTLVTLLYSFNPFPSSRQIQSLKRLTTPLVSFSPPAESTVPRDRSTHSSLSLPLFVCLSASFPFSTCTCRTFSHQDLYHAYFSIPPHPVDPRQTFFFYARLRAF